MIERVDTALMTDPAAQKLPIEATESAEPTEPTDRTDPTEPMDRTDPRHPMHSTESVEHRDQRELDGLGL